MVRKRPAANRNHHANPALVRRTTPANRNADLSPTPTHYPARVSASARTIGYLGPHGTFTEQALLSDTTLATCDRQLFTSMPAVLNAVEAGELDLGFCAIENSIEGTVNATIDTLAFSSELLIQQEIVIPISMHLLGLASTDISRVTKVLSFPHAIAQCRQWLRTNLPHAEQIAANSTADAVAQAAELSDPTVVAVGNELAGSIFGLNSLAANIQDVADNQTRFVTVARKGVPRITGNDKTSIVIFQRDDRPGSLLSILQEFSARSINLSKLESRPTKQGLGDYCFIMDLDGHIADEVIADALKNIMAKQAEVKFLGSYPTAGNGSSAIRAEANAAWSSAQTWLDSLRSQIADETN